MTPDWTSPDGSCRLYCGDCLNVLPTLEPGSVDAVVTDPPYGIGFSGHGQRFANSSSIAGDDSLLVSARVAGWAHLNGQIPLVMFFSPYNWCDFGWRSLLVWSKGAHVGIGGDRETCWKRDFELIGIRDNRKLNGKRDSAVLSFPALLPPPSGHVAEKPADLMEYLIAKVSGHAQSICDPCMGSATTGVACVRTGRKFIGIEIEPKYFEIAKRRIMEEIDRTALLDSTIGRAEKQEELW